MVKLEIRWQAGHRLFQDLRVTYRLLVVDIDGTLVGKGGTISTPDKEAINKASRTGVTVSLSTGRVARASAPIISQLNLDGNHIFFDGAFVGKVSGEKVYARPLEKKMVRQAINFARQNNIYLELYSTTQYFIERETRSARVHREYFGIEPTKVDFDTLWDREIIIKGELFTSSPDEETQARSFEKEFGGTLRFSWASAPAYPGVHFINIVHPGVSKGIALEALAAYLKVPLSEVMAVGDGTNDIPLLASAGLAVAMGNAPAEVKAVADFVTLDVEHSGLAKAIDKFLLSG